MPESRLPPELRDALVAAGYALSDEVAESLGILALDAAVAVGRAAGNLGGATPPAAQVGRNDPCPCGSGKKYKKCCLDVKPAAVAEPEPEPDGPTPLDDPRVIPCLDGPEGWTRAAERLEALLLDDPDLRVVRFDELAVNEYLFEHADAIEAAHATHDADRVQDVLEGLASDFARHADKMVTLKRLARALKEVAPRYRHDTSALMGLATGVAFAALPSADEELPLASLLFRMATHHPMEDRERVQKRLAPDDEELADFLGTAGSETLKTSRPTVQADADAAAALERLIARAEAFEDRLSGMISEGRFPLAPPFCLWVLMQRQARKATGWSPSAGAEPEATGDGWLDTVAATYADALGAWLDDHPAAPRPVRGVVRQCASQLADHGFTRVTLELLNRAIQHKWTSFLPGEAELLQGLDPVALTAERSSAALEAYLAFLVEAEHGDVADLLRATESLPATP